MINYLNRVNRPSRYLMPETTALKLNKTGEKLAVFYAGSYEESVNSDFFQGFIQCFDRHEQISPERFYVYDDDFLAIADIKNLKSHQFETFLIDCQTIVLCIEDSSKIFQCLYMLKKNKRTVDIIVQNSLISHALFYNDSLISCVGQDSGKLKQIIKESKSIAELKLILREKSENNVVKMDALNGIPIFGNCICPLVPVQSSHLQFSYVAQAMEWKYPEIFQTQSNHIDQNRWANRKKINQLMGQSPDANEIYLFPIGLTVKIRQLLSIQKTYIEFLPTVRKALIMGWRVFHIAFCFGQPVEDDEDIKTFKKEIQELYEFIKRYKKISIHLYFQGFLPTGYSQFLWDEVLDRNSYETKQKRLLQVMENKESINTHFESFEAYLQRLISLRGSAESINKINTIDFENLSFESVMKRALEISEADSTLFAGRPFTLQANLYFADYQRLSNQRKELSKLLVDFKADEEGELDLRLIKKAYPNAWIHLNKQLDNTSINLAVEEMSYGRSVKIRAAQTEDIVRRYRIHFDKKSIFRYFSSQDMRYIFIKSMELAKIPIAMSKGYQPSPKIAFSLASGLGIDSNAEYVDIDINSFKELDLKQSLQVFLPSGLTILSSKEISPKSASLASVITFNDYLITLDSANYESVKKDLINGIEFIRQSKSASIVLNSKDFIESISQGDMGLVLRLKTSENRILKAEEIIEILETNYSIGRNDIHITRIAQWIFKDKNLLSPMEI